MGQCGSLPEGAVKNAEIERKMQDYQEEEDKIIKLLLLGAGESGKSTIFKQMKILHGKGFDDAERKGYTGTVFSNILKNARILIQEAENMRISIGDMDAAQQIRNLPQDSRVNANAGKLLRRLWSDSGIQNTYNKRSLFQLPAPNA